VKLSRDKVVRLSHLIFNEFNNDEEIEFFAEPSEIRQDIFKMIEGEMKADEAIDVIVRRKIRPRSGRSWRAPTSGRSSTGSTTRTRWAATAR